MQAGKKADSGLTYPKMKALKLVLKLDPIQLGVYYSTDASRKQKRLYLLELQNLLLIGDAEKITEAIYEQHSSIFRNDKIPFEQVMNLIQKMLEFIQNEIMDDDEVIDSSEQSPQKDRQVT